MRLYIDPGTGSMLFTIIIGLIGTLGFALRALWVKLRFWFSGGKHKGTDDESAQFVIFSDDKRYWPVFEPVVRELDKRGVDVIYMTASEDDPALDNPYPHIKGEFIGNGNKPFSKLNFLEATLLLATTPGLDVYQWKRSKKVKYYVHMLHCANESTLYRMFALDYYDAVLLSGDYQADDLRELEAKRKTTPKELYKIGIPYMDEMVKRLKAEDEKGKVPPRADGKKTILLAPSWGPSSIFNKFGGKIIDTLLEGGFHVVVRPHPQSFKSETELMDKLTASYPESDDLEWNRDVDNFNVLRRSDLLISDFSGIVFDFSLVYDKPVIYADTTFDSSPYDCWWLDRDKIWTFETLPKLGMQVTEENLKDLPQMIEKCISDPSFAEGRNIARSETWAYPGEGAVRAADWLVAKFEELKKGEGESK